MNRAETAKASTQSYDLFVFGDSLSDIGQLFKKTGLPPVPYKDGRFSNGPVAVETLAEDLGFNISLETNFAIGGAYSGNQNVNDNPVVKFGGALDQVNQFKSQAASLGADDKDLYFIWAGGNDFLNLPSTDPTVVSNTITSAVTNIVNSVTSLAQSGAKNIVVVQSPNLGRVPIVTEKGAEASAALKTVSEGFNTALEGKLNPLEQSLGVNIILSNLFPTSESIAAAPNQFGFSNVTDSYLKKLTGGDITANPDQFFFWDDVHPTTKAHSVFADVLSNNVITGITTKVNRTGTEDADKLVSFSGNDRLNGLGGADILEGNLGDDQLWGDRGDDSLIGGQGNDLLVGDRGRDTLLGTTATDAQPGLNEMDMLRGGGNADVFVLGDQKRAFYNDGQASTRGLKDFALIADWQQGDKIELFGDRSQYVIQRTLPVLPSGVSIYLKTDQQNELIGIVQNVNQTNVINNALTFVA